MSAACPDPATTFHICRYAGCSMTHELVAIAFDRGICFPANDPAFWTLWLRLYARKRAQPLQHNRHQPRLLVEGAAWG